MLPWNYQLLLPIFFIHWEMYIPALSTLPSAPGSPDHLVTPQLRWWASPPLSWLLDSLHQRVKGGFHHSGPSEDTDTVRKLTKLTKSNVCMWKLELIWSPSCVLPAFHVNRHQTKEAEPSSSSGSSCHTWWWAPIPTIQVMNDLAVVVVVKGKWHHVSLKSCMHFFGWYWFLNKDVLIDELYFLFHTGDPTWWL